MLSNIITVNGTAGWRMRIETEAPMNVAERFARAFNELCEYDGTMRVVENVPKKTCEPS